MTTLSDINHARTLLIQERDAILDKITQNEFPNVNIVNVLRRAVTEYYAPKLDMLNFQFNFIQNYKETK